MKRLKRETRMLDKEQNKASSNSMHHLALLKLLLIILTIIFDVRGLRMHDGMIKQQR